MTALAAPSDPDPHTDHRDHRPVHRVRLGAPLVPDLRAWRRLAIGHRCETWLVWSVPHGTPAVVKLPRPDQLDHPRALRSLAREAEILGGHPHPDLPRLLADRLDAAVPHVVVEHVDGPALDELVDDAGPAGGHDVLTLAARLLAPLRWLHRHGVAHLDLTPANVLVRDAHPVLIDLGSARRIGRPQSGGNPIGSAGYTAPELEAGEPITAAMDLYGLGATLAQARLGEPVFDPAVAPERRPDPGLPDDPVGNVLRALLAPDPSARPPSCDAALDLLAAAVEATGCPAVAPAFATRTPSGGTR